MQLKEILLTFGVKSEKINEILNNTKDKDDFEWFLENAPILYVLDYLIERGWLYD